MIPRSCPSCLIGRFSEQTLRCTNCNMHVERAEYLRTKGFANADFGPMTQAELDAINMHAKPVHIDPGLLDEINDMIDKAAGITPDVMAKVKVSRTADEAMARLNERVRAEREKQEAQRKQRERDEAARREADERRKAKEREAEELRKAAESFKNVDKEAERIRKRREEQDDMLRQFAEAQRANAYGQFYDEMFGQFGFQSGRRNGREHARQQAEQQTAQRTGGIDLDLPMLRRLIQLCHPDKHNSSEASKTATQFLLGLKAKMEAGR